MIVRRDHDQRIFQKRVTFGRQCIRRHAHDVEIVTVGGQAFDRLIAIDDFQFHIDAWIETTEGPEQTRNEIFRGGDDGHAQGAGFDAFEVGRFHLEARPGIK